jgi:hypothetical protein
MKQKCARCGVEDDPDLRTLWMACMYAMDELNVPFEELGLTTVDKAGQQCVTRSRPFYTLRVCKDCRADWMRTIEQWFNTSEEQGQTSTGTGVFVRRNGTSVELTLAEVEEWKEQHDGQEPVRVSG